MREVLDRSIEAREVQYSNAESLMEVREAGNVTEAILMSEVKASSAMDVQASSKVRAPLGDKVYPPAVPPHSFAPAVRNETMVRKNNTTHNKYFFIKTSNFRKND